MPFEAWLVGISTLLIASGIALFGFLVLRRSYPDDEPEPEDFVPATVSPSYRPVPAWHDLVTPAPARCRRDDDETRVLHVVPAMCGCLDGGIQPVPDEFYPWCRRCGGAC